MRAFPPAVPNQVHLVVPEGTKILTRPAGRAGIVAHAPGAPSTAIASDLLMVPRRAFTEPTLRFSNTGRMKRLEE
jgi:hypothetical protein